MNWFLVVLLFNGAGSAASGTTTIGPYYTHSDCEKASTFVKSREHFCVPRPLVGRDGNAMREFPEEFD